VSRNIYSFFFEENGHGFRVLVHLESIHFFSQGKTLKLVNVVRATERGAAAWRLYITFMAQEYRDGPLVEYQAKVIVFLGDEENRFPVLCRESPKPGI